MTAQILSAELSNLVQESKRKHPELRNAAEKSLQDLKGISVTSESQLTADLVRRPYFINPFLIACTSKNSKFASSGAGCIQRLAISNALPKDRLREVIEALRESSSFGLDVQLKILQTLSALTQNYSNNIRGDLLFGLLQVCSTLQASKQASVSNSAAATLQQVVSALFEGLEAEDAASNDIPAVDTVTCGDETFRVRPVAHDAFRIFHDLCLLTEGQNPLFLKTTSLPQASGLELIESVLASHPSVFVMHPEQANTLRTVLLPYLIRSLSERQSFPVTVRILRVFVVVVRHHLALVPSECEITLSLLNHMLDPDVAVPWKRALCMEVFRFIYNDVNVVLRLCASHDGEHGKKQVLRDNLAIFVRLASEKPSLIGLGQQSTLPSGQHSDDGSQDAATLDTTGVTGLISGISPSSTSAPGISINGSSVKTALLDQLDKSDPPSLPETYIYSLVLTCINNFSDSIAKFILPLTVQRESRGRKRADTHSSAELEVANLALDGLETSKKPPEGHESSGLHRRRTVPENPLQLKNHKSYEGIVSIGALIDHSWPAVLAACSTFLYAALDNEYYRALVRSFQKFTQVAGLLRMATPRDAFLTTLGKAAVPANIVAASLSPMTPIAESPSFFSGSKGLLGVDNLATPTTPVDKDGRLAADHPSPTLSARNLLCLRALLNIAIALGPTLESAWNIICETLQQAEMIMATSSTRGSGRDPRSYFKSPQRADGDEPSSQTVANEINAVQAAAARMFESSSDFPNDAFNFLLGALCKLLQPEDTKKTNESKPPSSPNPRLHQRRIGSFSAISINTESQAQDYILALRKVGEVATLNCDRFTHVEPAASGWTILTAQLISIACDNGIAHSARRLAAEVLSTIVQDCVRLSSSEDAEVHGVVQERCFSSLRTAIDGLGAPETKQSRDLDSEIHHIWLEALRSAIERSGDTITSGWNYVFEIILTAFQPHSLPALRKDRIGEQKTEIDVQVSFKHLKLGRSAFDSTQLICSDFLRIVDKGLLPTIVDVLFRFCAQREDLNISLTMTALFWNISDFVNSYMQTAALVTKVQNLAPQEPVQPANQPPEAADAAVLVWLQLLHRMVIITADVRPEVRDSAVHSALRIFSNSELSKSAWQTCFNEILLQMLDLNIDRHKDAFTADNKVVSGWNNSSRIILDGFCDLLIANMDTLADGAQWSTLWESIAERFESFLQLQSQTLHGIIYSNLVKVLSQFQEQRKNFEDVDVILNLWLAYAPVRAAPDGHTVTTAPSEAYVQCFQEIYRLFHPRLLYSPTAPLTLERSATGSKPGSPMDLFKKHLEISIRLEDDLHAKPQERTLPKLHQCVGSLLVTAASSPAIPYSDDTDKVSDLQASVLACLRNIHDKSHKAQPLLVASLARAIALPLDQEQNDERVKRRPTFVAFSKAAMQLLDNVVSDTEQNKADLTTDALALALASLAQPILLKYQWPIPGKPTPLWQVATTTALNVMQHCLPILAQQSTSGSQDLIQQVWLLIVNISHAIASADCSECENLETVFQEEEWDTQSLAILKTLIVPALGSTSIADSTRRLYTSSLFLNSLVLEAEPGEYPEPPAEPLQRLYDIRLGRTYSPPAVVRSKMAYQCLTDLLSLTEAHTKDDKFGVERVALARAAAPYLILRAALPIKRYIADQVLRGRMPQPANERAELLFVLRHMRELSCEPKAIPETAGAHSEHRRHLLRLYPLLTKALMVAGQCRGMAKDDELIQEMTKWLDAVGDEFEI